MKYRKKPVEVEAIQWTGNNFEEVKAFTNGKAYKSLINDNTLVLDTLSGKHLILINYFIIKGTQTEFFEFNICNPDLFKKTYEEVENTKYFLHGEEMIMSINTGKYLSMSNGTAKILANEEELPQWAKELTTGSVSEMRNIK